MPKTWVQPPWLRNPVAASIRKSDSALPGVPPGQALEPAGLGFLQKRSHVGGASVSEQRCSR